MATELPHPDDLEFAPTRADLARLYLAHKYELSMADWPDDEIVARTSDISAALVALTCTPARTAIKRGSTGTHGSSRPARGCSTTTTRCASTGERATQVQRVLAVHSASTGARLQRAAARRRQRQAACGVSGSAFGSTGGGLVGGGSVGASGSDGVAGVLTASVAGRGSGASVSSGLGSAVGSVSAVMVFLPSLRFRPRAPRGED